MQLNVELVDVADHFGALRFVFGETSLQFFQSIVRRRVFYRRRRRWSPWNVDPFSTTRTGKNMSRGGRVDHERGGAMLALENNIA